MIGWFLALLVAQAAPAGVVPVARGEMSAVEEPKQVIARTPAEWSALWKSHDGSRPAPAVDLSQRMVVAVFLGTRPSAGYGVDIRAARVRSGALVVEYAEARPDPGGITAQVITSPFQIVTVPSRDGPVQFEKVP